MATVKPIFRPTAAWIAFFNFLACLAVIAGGYWLLQTLQVEMQTVLRSQSPAPEIASLARRMEMAQRIFWPYVVPGAGLFFLVLTLFAWLAVHRVLKRRWPAATPRRPAPAAPAAKAVAAKEVLDMNQRIFLHLIAALQKEGRLLDFFSENLAQYNDGQIGAAVRSIHENCKRTIDKYLSPQSVIDLNEGDEISVEKDFDPNTLKLVGNVTGQPPFKGVVRHRGWRARKIDLPTLSGQPDPGIIVPAEIEIR